MRCVRTHTTVTGPSRVCPLSPYHTTYPPTAITQLMLYTSISYDLRRDLRRPSILFRTSREAGWRLCAARCPPRTPPASRTPRAAQYLSLPRPPSHVPSDQLSADTILSKSIRVDRSTCLGPACVVLGCHGRPPTRLPRQVSSGFVNCVTGGEASSPGFVNCRSGGASREHGGVIDHPGMTPRLAPSL